MLEDWVIDRDRAREVLDAAARLMARPMLPTGAGVDYDAAYTFI